MSISIIQIIKIDGMFFISDMLFDLKYKIYNGWYCFVKVVNKCRENASSVYSIVKKCQYINSFYDNCLTTHLLNNIFKYQIF